MINPTYVKCHGCGVEYDTSSEMSRWVYETHNCDDNVCEENDNADSEDVAYYHPSER